MNRHEGASLDSSLKTAGAEWLGAGPWGSGDYRGYWIEKVFRPTDYGVTGSANLLLYDDSNVSLAANASLITAKGGTVTSVGTNPNTVASTTGHPATGAGTPFTITINSSYLIGFCHTEDYSSSGIVNNNRTIYSFDNGVHWTKGPWVNYGGSAVITTIDTTGHYSPTGTQALVGYGAATYDLTTGASGRFTFTVTGGSSGLIYNRYLQQWMSFYSTSDQFSQPNAGVVGSGDLVNWYKMLPYGGFLYVDNGLGKVGSQLGDYPTIVGGYPTSMPSGKSLTSECGQLAWLYNNSGGLSARAIGFIKQTQQDLTWNGSVNSHLATAGNWSVSPGFTGSFSGFTDEVNSMTIGGTGGTLTNDIPGSTVRVRGLTYTAGAGAYTITGSTPLSMEAYVTQNYPASNNATVFGITNNSNNVQEIDSPINVRTAALYLNVANTGTLSGSTVTGCGLNLTGAIDMMGSGGVVVYGSGITELSGGINDSGYTDFSSGAPEYIVSADEGRLVMDGTGTLVLSGTGNFTGRTDILFGTVQLNSANALQNSVVSVTTGAPNSLVLNTDAAIGGLNGTDSLTLNHSLTIGNNNAANNFATKYTGVISGSGSVIKTGSNTQTLGGNNTFSGGITLQQGMLQLAAGASSLGTGSFAFNGGGLSATGNLVISNNITLSSNSAIYTNSNTVILNGVISGSGSLVLEGNSTTPNSGTVALNGYNTFTGGVTVDNLLQISTTGAVGAGTLTLNGGTLQLTASVGLGSSGLAVTGTGGTIDTQNFNLTSSGAISSATGVPLTKLGTGTFTWSGSSTVFNGDLIVSGGTFNYTAAGTNTFSNGNVTLNGSVLTLAPTGAGASSISLASGANAFTVNGSATVNLVQGSAAAMTVNIGTLTLGNSSLFLNVPGGTSTLGQTSGVTLLAGGQTETPAGQIYSPSVVVGDPVNGDDFVTYDTTAGFSAFTGYTTHSGSYSVPTTTSTEVADITGAATLSANSYAQALVISGSNTLSLNAKTYTMNGAGGMAGVLLNNGTINGSGSLTFGTNHGIIFVGGSAAAVNGVLKGSGGITIAGPAGAQVTLSGSNTFTGGVTIEGAKVLSTEAGLGASGGTITLDGQGIVDPSGDLYRNITINNGGGTIEVDIASVTLENVVTGNGPLHKTGAGTLILAAAYNGAGAIYLDQGVLQGNAGALDHAAGNIVVASGATCLGTESSGYNITHSFTLSGTGTTGQGALLVGGGGGLTGNITLAADALIGTNSTGGLTLSGLISGAGTNLQISSTTGTLTLAGNVSIGAGNLTFSGADGTVLSTSFQGNETGTTTINAGTAVALNGAFNGTANVIVNGTLSGSSGTVNTAGAVTVNSGGTLIPGTQSAGLSTGASVIEINGNLNLNSGSVMQSYVSNADGISDGSLTSGNGMVWVNGTATLAGTLNIYYASGYVPASGTTLWLVLRNAADGSNSVFSNINVYPAGSTSATTTYTGLPDGGSIVVNGVTGTIHYASHNSIDLTSGSSDVCITFP